MSKAPRAFSALILTMAATAGVVISVVEAQQKNHRKGNLFQVKVFLVVPGGEIVIDRAGPKNPAHEEWQVALRDAFDAATRRLEEYARKTRGEVKTRALS